ncbi:MAG: phage holin family protein [Deltaproteobacteria bacterium]|nr:MAG: phage holin family protein [Deltaproteobacteria bacterium]
MGTPAPSLDALQRLIDGLQTLLREHIALARAEVKEELRNTGRELLVSAAGVPALAAGYLLLTIALGFLLAVWIPQWAAFGIVALANLGAGAILTLFWGRRALRQRLSLPRTGEELRRDKEWLAALKKGERALPEQVSQH